MTSLIKGIMPLVNLSSIHLNIQIRHLWPIKFYAYRTESHQPWLFRVMHPQPHSFLGTGTWGHDLHCRKDEGQQCVCMCACAAMAQWEVDDECFWLDNWFAPVFTFNLWWAWPVEGSQSGTAGFSPKRLNGLSKSHRKLCQSLTNAYWEFPWFPSSWYQADADKRQQHNFTLTLTEQIISEGAFWNVNVCDLNTVTKYSLLH